MGFVLSAVICPAGTEVKVCPDVCLNRTCDTYPEALCIQNPCSCQPLFLDPENWSEVNCHTC